MLLFIFRKTLFGVFVLQPSFESFIQNAQVVVLLFEESEVDVVSFIVVSYFFPSFGHPFYNLSHL